jgi:hypothetical protein
MPVKCFHAKIRRGITEIRKGCRLPYYLLCFRFNVKCFVFNVTVLSSLFSDNPFIKIVSIDLK